MTMKTYTLKLLRTGAMVSLSLVAACAGTQTKPDERPALDDDRAAGPGGVDPLADVRKPAPGQGSASARKVDEDERADFEKAVERYAKMKAQGPLKGGDCDDAAKAFRKAADSHANLVEARHNEAAVYYECGKEAEAIAIWEKLAAGPKPYTPSMASLGYITWKKGDSERAVQMFEKAISLDQKVNSVPARLNLAMLLRERARRTGNPGEKARFNEQAQTQLRAVLALDGSNMQAYAALAYLYYDINFLDAAILVGNQAIMRAQEIATGKTVEELSDGAGDDAGGAGKKGKGARGKKDDEPKTAREVQGQGTGYTPEMKKALGMVYNTLGLVDLKRQQVSKAIANFRRAVENDPDLFEARMNWASLALNFRDYASAEQNLRAVLTAQPKNYDAAIGLGVALRGQKKVDEAEQQYLAASKLDPSRPDAFFNLGLLYQEYKGSDRPVLEQAQKYYREYLAKAGGATGKKAVEKRIKDIDEMFVALAEAEKLQREAEELQRKAEEQQKKMEEEMKKMQEQEKAQGGTAQAPAGN
jgi:tetratricopeptide (TPR) repeat protein